ncbi:TPA: recombinase family protein [Klebsiella pneumoniae]|uniref:DNA-invertase hin n=1 Tax=Escherichia coli TaxID=562 RepID=A0A899NEP5_ECOLX|nr:recombinase family protein [Escherichia coli]HBX3047647.1 recombinase family protein [Klebsiella pneumoniae]EER4149557.1 recombinase family protein [Escherichia coli]EER4150201.1 recombinase family protein [Escherichia coli]EIG1699250.1 recombinase family protein [Escherichia coli]EIG1699937.1 recombinase family protein [Escherichia coli]
MLIGYARVSTADQDLTLQLNALAAAGCDKIFTDKASGTKANRDGLAEALAYARQGDCLVVWKLDRLGRSMKGLVDLAADLESRKVDLRSLTDGIDTKTAAGRFFFHVMAALAVMERELILERTKAGLDAAKRAGRVGGRRRAMTPAKMDAARKLLEGGTSPKDVATSIGVSVATLYRYFPASDRET